MSGNWTIVADLDLCQGHQMCQLDAPEIFGFDQAADKVVVRQPHPPTELHATARQAIAGCPSMALSLAPPSTPVKED